MPIEPLIDWIRDHSPAPYQLDEPIPEELRCGLAEEQIRECVGWDYARAADGDEYPYLDLEWTRELLEAELGAIGLPPGG
jgi:hypothetical protein